MKNVTINVQGQNITIFSSGEDDYICLTDMVRSEEGTDHIKNWMRNRNTIEFLGLWESMNNPDFKGVEFDTFRKEAGLNSFTLTPQKWISATNAKGIISKSGRNGGTYAHKDIAFEFGSWISPAFKLYLIREFQRLKEEEAKRSNLDWNLQRFLSKVNYRIHTDAVKDFIIPSLDIPSNRHGFIYADEAELLNYALFDMTSKEWREKNPDKAKGNMRDYSSIAQLTVLSNLESINAAYIADSIPQKDRLIKLRKIAVTQLNSLLKTSALSGISAPNLFDDRISNAPKIENKK